MKNGQGGDSTANRKEYELLFKLTAALGGNFHGTFSKAMTTTKELQGTLSKINSLSGKIDGYTRQSAAVEKNRLKLVELQKEHDKLQREMQQTEAPSEALKKKFERNEKQIAATTSKIEDQQKRLNALGEELKDAGINTDNLSASNAKLQKSYDKIKKSQEEVAKLSAERAKTSAEISKTKTELAGTVGTIAALSAALYAGPVKNAAEFQSQMSTVQSISGATAQEMAQLNTLAKTMGIKTKFSAVESGKALEYMSMAGWKTKQMIGGLPGIMNLAAASGEDLGTVSDIVTDALTAFNMTAEDSARFADVLAQASSNANTNVAMMGATFQKVAPVAGALNYSVEDMSLGIGLMANASIKAEVAGTSLKTAIANMAKPTKQMQSYMDKYHISLTNTDGSLKSFRGVIDNLRSSLGGLSEAEQVAAASAIFGKESFAGMLAIVNASETDFKKLSDSVNNSAGAAERMAKIKLDNLNGEITLAKSAFEGLQIALGEAFLPTLSDTIKKVTEVVQQLAEFASANPELVRQIVKVVGGMLLFKAGALGLKLAFLDVKQGINAVQMVMALFKGKTAAAGIEAVGLTSKLKAAGTGISGYFGGIKNAAGGVGGAFSKIFSGGKIAGAFSKIGTVASGTFGKAFTAIGGQLTNILGGKAGKIVGIFGKAGGKIAAGPLGKIGLLIGKGIGNITTLLGPIGKLGGAIIGPFGGILGKILPIVGVITLIISVIQILRNNMDKVRAVVERVFGKAGLAAFDKFIGFISKISEAVKGFLSDGGLADIQAVIDKTFGNNPTLAAFLNSFIAIFHTIGNVLSDYVGFVSREVAPLVQEFFGYIANTVLPALAAKFTEWAPTIQAIIVGLGQAIQGVISFVVSAIQVALPVIKLIFENVFSVIGGLISGLLTAIKGIVNFITGVFSGDLQKALGGVKDIFGGAFEAIKAVVMGPINFISDSISGLIEKIKGIGKGKIEASTAADGSVGVKVDGFAKGTRRTPDTFIAGERGAELITNARNRTVFTALQTSNILNTVRGVIAAVQSAGGAFMGLPQLAYAGAGGVTPPSVTAFAPRQSSVVIHSAPVFHVGSGTDTAELEAALRRHDEELLNEVEARQRKKDNDERRTQYD